MAGDKRSTRLGPYTFDVVPQRIAYLQRKLGSVIGDLVKVEGGSGEDIVAGLGDRAYDVLAIFIPDLGQQMPRHEWLGQNPDGSPVDDADDKSPTFPEVVEAFRAGIEVNQLSMFQRLGKLFDADLLRSALSVRMADFLERSGPDSAS